LKINIGEKIMTLKNQVSVEIEQDEKNILGSKARQMLRKPNKEVTEEEIDQMMELKELAEKKPSPPPEMEELEALDKRIKAGEKVDATEIKAIERKLKRLEVKGEIISARMKPAMDQLQGHSNAEEIVNYVNANYLSAYLKKDIEKAEPFEELLIDQFSTLHKLGMETLGRIYHTEELYPSMLTDYVNLGVKLLNSSQKAIETIQRLRHGGKQTVVVKHQHVQVNDGGQAVVANDIVKQGGGVGVKNKNEKRPHAMEYAFQKAARCGAKTRQGTSCQAPAVQDKKRCRMHGGANGSGAPKGNKNAYKYGHYTREAIEERLFLRRLLKSCDQTRGFF